LVFIKYLMYVKITYLLLLLSVFSVNLIKSFI
jgi:hypothetical protein